MTVAFRKITYFVLISTFLILMFGSGHIFAQDQSPGKKASAEIDINALEQETLARQNKTPIAKVGEVVIPRWMFDNAVNDVVSKKNIANHPAGREYRKAKAEAMENLVNMELLFAEAKRAGLSLNKAAGDLRTGIIERSYKNPEAFATALARAGMTREQYSAIWQQQALVNLFVTEKIAARVKISDRELRALYEQVKGTFKRPAQAKASHILVKVGKDASPEERSQAGERVEKILQRLKKGEEFAALAKEVSDCPSATEGGDLGWFPRRKMTKPFSDAAFALKKDELSDIVETKFGYHVILKTGDRPEGLADFEEVKPQLIETIKEVKIPEALKKCLVELRKKVKIEVYE